MDKLLISFSGGETSGYMTKWLLENNYQYNQIAIVFANTGEENKQTLEFVDRCDKAFGFRTVWIEGVQFPGERRASNFKVVDFQTAARNGEPFEAAISKYGIPNFKFKDCTRNLKRKPIEAYAREGLGWGEYDLAIGIRADEIDRMTSDQSRRIIYPLISPHPMTKPKINAFWSQQSFRLELKGYQGNCKWCWKKSLRKHLTLIQETPQVYDFPRRMEALYGGVGAEFLKDTSEFPLPDNYRRTFFRGNLSVEDLFRIYEDRRDTLIPATDDSLNFDFELDVGSGCEESCEVFADEDERVE